MKNSKTWAVIPAHNEEKNIAKVVQKSMKFVEKVIVVDDGSADNTSDLAEKEGAIVLKHIVNMGKGAALKTGCDFAVRKEVDYIIVLDADAQHNPGDIPRFKEKLRKYDIVFGYRKLSGKMPALLRFGNRFISQATKFLYGISLYDTQSGYRAFSRNAYKKIRWNSSDYSMESEMVARVGKQKLKYVQIPIETIYTDKYKGTTILDGMKIVLNMFWWKILNGRQ